MVATNVVFEFDSIDSEGRFLRTYLSDAWERFESSEFFETGRRFRILAGVLTIVLLRRWFHEPHGADF